jgi:hypothetical protein
MASVAPETPVRASEPIADGAPPLLSEGPRAPVWVMVMLLLSLVAIAMVQWAPHWALRSTRFSISAAIQAAAQLPRRAALLTLDYRIVLPLMLAVITAHYVARSYTGVRPMYAESLLPREKPVQASG